MAEAEEADAEALEAVRRAVRPAVADGLRPGEPVVVACSGGADSLALVAAAVHGAPGRPVVGATVDHGLQAGSAEQAARVVRQMAALGVAETLTATVEVRAEGRGPEAAAREARYAVLEQVAERVGTSRVLLGHTLDDQAETVLLGLTRGSGARSLRGMRASFDVFVRPLLGVRRAQTEAACRALGITWWEDPHNTDPRFTRARVRHDVLPVLERELGPGVAESLARTARLLHEDTAALDALAEERFAALDRAGALPVADLRPLPAAVRLRVLRLAALAAGALASELFEVHLRALDDQVHNLDRLPRQVQLPGHVRAVRSGDTLTFSGDRPGP